MNSADANLVQPTKQILGRTTGATMAEARRADMMVHQDSLPGTVARSDFYRRKKRRKENKLAAKLTNFYFRAGRLGRYKVVKMNGRFAIITS